MTLWDEIIKLLVKAKDFIFELRVEQIAVISIAITLILLLMERQSEMKFKKQKIRRVEYQELIKLLYNCLSGGISPDDSDDPKLFDIGASLLLCGSKRIYKKYIFFREYMGNPIAQKSKYNNKKVLQYVVADIFKTIRREAGLTGLKDMELSKILLLLAKDIGTNPMSRIELCKSRYNVLMIKSELFFYQHKLLMAKKIYYHIIKPVLGVIGAGLKYLLLLIRKMANCVKGTPGSRKAALGGDRPKEKDTLHQKTERKTKQKVKLGFVAGLFALEWKLQRWVEQTLWSKTALFSKWCVFLFFVFLILYFLVAFCGVVPMEIACWLLGFFSIGCLLCAILTDLQKAMTTLGGFMDIGKLLLSLAFLGITGIWYIYNDLLTIVAVQPLMYLVASCIMAIIWAIYSSFCNIKVSTLANGLLTGGLSLIVVTKDLVIKVLSLIGDPSPFGNEVAAEIESWGCSISQFFDTIIYLMIYPFLIITVLATMVCAAKQYWIEKYNNNEDIEFFTTEHND